MVGAPLAPLSINGEHCRSSRHPVCCVLLGEGVGAGVKCFPGAERSHVISVFGDAVQPHRELVCEVGQ